VVLVAAVVVEVAGEAIVSVVDVVVFDPDGWQATTSSETTTSTAIL
jgi:hypothetical protein